MNQSDMGDSRASPRAQTSTTGHAKSIVGVQQPGSVDEVIELVHWARSTGARLYPVSRGLNWGYGSATPATDGCLIVDLSRMNNIRNAEAINARNPVAVIEPGVTQAQLYDHLEAHCPSLTFNVTGSGRDTSILGNALDRGVGYLGPRKEDVFGLEFVDGQGRLLKTGFRRLGEDSPLAHCHPYGLGPMLDGLLSQGSIGIVTSACFRLVPRRPREVAVSLTLRDVENFSAFLDSLIALKREGLMTSVAHIGNRARTETTLRYGITQYLQQRCGLSGRSLSDAADQALKVAARGEWSALASVTGNAGQVRAALKEIRSRTSRLADVRVVTDKLLDIGYAVTDRLRAWPTCRATAAAISAIRPLHGLALGKPTNVAIENLLWRGGQEELAPGAFDESHCGLLYVSPALPADGAFISRIMAVLNTVAARHGHKLYTTVNLETPLSTVAIINLLFDRRDAQAVAGAHRCADALWTCIREHGLEVYRARADMMPGVTDTAPEYWQAIGDLKAALDPLNIISPGRYAARERRESLHKPVSQTLDEL
ncbi:FAD-binding oxidoreductase [Aquincola tertiaricarbonis]|uniref:FAD-binding oxidoreductase n=1 Tax=Aquincola tertiaricarbonis TaxID=391953 RepID=A0ABY4SGV2_AQUTE|nr:FAD-binding oxidoreductase [Aquincola tertiaricarbonis]URI10439.1 FAD-binding oxidoreductase [Aquincola tertiaricarbonis]